MAQCPSCGASLSEDYGLVTCGSCNAVLMIDAEGEVRMGSEAPFVEESVTGFDESRHTSTNTDSLSNWDENPEADGSFESEDSMIDEDSNTDFIDDVDGPLEEEVQEAEIDSTADWGDDSDDSSSDGDSFSEVDDNLDEQDLTDEVASDGADDDSTGVTNEPLAVDTYSTDLPSEGPSIEPIDDEPETFAMPAAPDKTPVDITEFANSDESHAESGELRYDLTISRLDSADLKEALKYVLLDEKLKLNHHEHLKNITDGRVTIPDLNPIKAKRIVEQLQFFDLDIQWMQKRVIIETVEPELDGDEPDEIEDAEI